MMSFLKTISNKTLSFSRVVLSMGLKPISHFIDHTFRDKVTPVAGSVMYCDLWLGAEHSGIYVQQGQIANIEVTGFADSEVKYSDATDFTSKSVFGQSIYVSSNKYGAVGNSNVAAHATNSVGAPAFYGLVFNNCHTFSRRCVSHAPQQADIWDKATNFFKGLVDPEWELGIRQLKADARNRLGTTKWLLWDINQKQDVSEPDWQAQQDFFKNQALTPEFIQALRYEWAKTQTYQDEIADENVPKEILNKLSEFEQTLEEVSDAYSQVEAFLKVCPDSGLSFNDLRASHLDFAELAKELASNQKIQQLVHKMGRAYQSEYIQKRKKVPNLNQSEVHGTHKSNDLMRLLPSELVNFEDTELEMVFYARLIENQLLSYELQGIHWQHDNQNEEQKQRTGPVVACLDTSGSMSGKPLMKAKALLLAIATILKRENRSLHILLFSSSSQIKEYSLNSSKQIVGLLQFLQQGFGGGTDFEAPLRRAIEIIQKQPDYFKSDVLMISDGDAQVSDAFEQTFRVQKAQIGCAVYSVLCNGSRSQDNFSDEVISI
jgi:uncharacterized protein with von Willebrand factor type A (vWA) domain